MKVNVAKKTTKTISAKKAKKKTATKAAKASRKASASAARTGKATSTAKKAAPKKKTAKKVATKKVAPKKKVVKKKTTVKKASPAPKSGSNKPKKVAKKVTKKTVTAKTPAKTKTVTKKPGSNGQTKAPVKKIVKTYLSPEDLAEFREMLISKRRELVGDVTHLESEALRESGGGSSAMPIHMADLGSDAWEQELTFGLIENERGLLRKIDEALDRVENKTYGICLGTNKRISKSRLRAQPWAKYCIEYARKKELGLI